MMHTFRHMVLLVLALSLFLLHCSDSEYSSQLSVKPYFGTTSKYACDINNPPKPGEPPCDIDAFRLCAYSEHFNAIICNDYSVDEGKSGAQLKLPEADDYRIFFQGYNKAKPDVMLWCGATEKIGIKKGEKKDISVFIGRCSDFVFTRNKMSSPRVFHTATPLKDGRVLIAGGISAPSERSCDSDCDGKDCKPYCRIAEAIADVEIYDYKKGEFQKIGKLNIPRALHTATLLEDGRVIIAGGTKSVRLYLFPSQDRPFVMPDTMDEASSSIEIFDPQSNSFKKVSSSISRAMHTSYLAPDGKIYGFGGISDNSGNFESKIIEIDPKDGMKESKVSLSIGRVMPVVIDFSIIDPGNTTIAVTGGSLIDNSNNKGSSFDIISFSDVLPAVKEHKYSSREAFINAAFGVNALPVDTGKFILFGGYLMRDFKLGFKGKETDIFACNPLDYTYYFDLNNNNITYPERNSNLLNRRALSASIYLPFKTPRILITGGFESINNDLLTDNSYIPFIPSRAVETFLKASELFDSIHPFGIVDAANPIIKMNEARAGHSITLLPDQSILLVGGFSSSSDITNTSEVFQPYSADKDISLLIY